MSSTRLSPKLRDKGSSDAERPTRVRTNKRTLQFDLFAQLSYMSAIATAGVSRNDLFEHAAKLPYSSAQYFKNVTFAARTLNVDYAQACRMEADATDSEDVRGLLLRLAGSLASGENETKFLKRESGVIGERYSNQHAREVESLKKWTDAYVALIVAAALIVIVAIISMMIYEVGVAFVMGLAVGMVGVSCLGAWIIYVSAPHEIKTRASGPSSKLQKLGQALFNITTPLALALCSIVLLRGADLGWAALIGSAVIFPTAFVIKKTTGI